jgi:hypothetical protein
MKRTILTVGLLCVLLTLSAVVTETASLKAFLYGSAPQCEYDNWLSHISEGIASVNYNLYAPYDKQTNGFGNYVTPNTTQINAWETAIDAFLNGELETAQQVLTGAEIPYTVVIFNDTDTGRQLNMLRENLNLTYNDNNGTPDDPEDDEVGSFAYGWGIYIVYPQSTNPIIVNVVHPCDDFIVPPVAHKAFIDWQARYLMISGAGREVKWTNQNPYTNSKSLSDASRVSIHPFNSVYRKSADQIRTQFNRKEFSCQIHSYDWNRHEGYANLQISVANQSNIRDNVNLPNRDLSSLKNDVINNTDYIVFPQNTLGIHSEVGINDYYTVNYDTYDFYYDNNGTMIPVNNSNDLPGFAQNVQQNYTLTNTTYWDVFDPFYHVEFDELPNCYPQTDNNYFWFYGFNATTGKYDRDHLFDNVVTYYSKWVDAMTQTLPATLALNDNLTPAAPQNLAVDAEALNYIRLSWEAVDSYDFKTYEILYATEPIGDNNYTIFNRSNNAELASPRCEAINITGLAAGQNYYFKIRAVDYNNNVSPLSQQVTGNTGSAVIDNISFTTNSNQITVKWRATSQLNNQGFKIYRSNGSSNYTQIADWNSSPSLIGSTQSNLNYSYTDNTVSVNNTNIEFPHHEILQAQSQPIYALYFSNQAGTIVDSIFFSKNQFATDGKDTNFDFAKSTTTTGSYVWAGFYEQYWSSNGDYLLRETFGDYDQEQTYKTFVIRFKSNITTSPITVSVSDNFGRSTEKLYLRNLANSTYTDLGSSNAQFTVSDANYKTLYLYWGNINPEITIQNLSNCIIPGGTTKSFGFSTAFNFLNESHTVYLKNSTDSLLIAENLPANATTVLFNAPENVTMHNAKFYVMANAIDGEKIVEESEYTVGIAPAETQYTVPQGISMLSNPFLDHPITQSELSNSLDIYDFANQSFSPVTTMNYNRGYFLNNPTELTHNFTNNFQITNETQTMIPKWNLLGNPHVAPIKVKDLQFNYNGTLYLFNELVEHNVISPAVYICQNNNYQEALEIAPYQSFFVYANIDELQNLNCQFVPYNSKGIDYKPLTKEWKVKISAQQTDGDYLEIGTTTAKADTIDFKYDMPKLPVKPIENAISFYIPNSIDNEYGFTKLNSLYKNPLNTEQEDIEEWPFCLHINSLNPVTFTADRSQLPSNYTLRLVYNNSEHIFYANGNTITFIPEETGLIEGIIKVGNQFIGNDNNIQKPLSFSAYPNPFNPQTTLSLNLPKASQVEINIYNVKGQKVKKLVNSTLNAGTHNFIWNGTDSNNKKCGSNIYIAMVKVNGKSLSAKKITLLK